MSALLQLRQVRREYQAGEQKLVVLKDVDLDIAAGEFVAIVGASGSGKSTLMNILGCLDRPTAGSYQVAGRETGQLDPDELAALRREHFGFVFQRYHLLADLSALGNVETPAVYAGKSASERRERATRLLTRLGLAERLDHTPGQLSGGQQQRVSIARALMNGGSVILADEPTGALDSKSGVEMLALLAELHAEGHTIVLVTHDMQVAEHADRVIEISDGVIVADRRRERAGPPLAELLIAAQPNSWQAVRGRFLEAFRMALVAMNAHRLRTFLTMLGIIIGIASVVSVVALGAGSQQQILKNINSIGTNVIDIYPGSGFGDMRSARVRTLVPADADALALQSYVDSVTPMVSSSVTLRYRNASVTATVNGVGDQYFRVRGFEIAQGVAFDATSVRGQSQDVVIDDNTYQKLFGAASGTPPGTDPIGQVILLGNVPCRIIGVTAKKDSAFGSNESLNLFVPYTTAMSRLTGQNYLRSVTVRVDDAVAMDAAEAGITAVLKQRHGSQDFYVSNIDSIRQTIEQTTQTMTLLISSIALISLIVGGIGVMNIMLVSVTERTREIGVRMAVGARQSDILQQFLIEAVLVCLLGGLLGVLLAVGLGAIVAQTGSSFTMVYSTTSMIVAFACSTLIGVLFGFLPARNAARLDPVDALARD